MSGFQAAAVSGSVMILVIALLRLTARKRLPRALFPALWCAAAFRLLLPVRLPSALSVWNLTAGESRAARTAAQISEHLTPFPSLTAAPAAQEAAARLVRYRPAILPDPARHAAYADLAARFAAVRHHVSAINAILGRD